MFFSKIATFFLLALAVGAEKKIELQDIEEDNLRSELKSEQENDNDKSDGQQNEVSETGFNSLDFMKNGRLAFFDTFQNRPLELQQPLQQQQRYVHQYAVTEQPERYAPPINKVHRPQAPHQAMVGYLSNMPMQIYLVPQYYSGQSQTTQPHRVELNQDSEPYDTSTANDYEQNFVTPMQVAYYYHTQPTAATTLTAAQPLVGYQVSPSIHYEPRLLLPTNTPKTHFGNIGHSDTNAIDEIVTRTPYSMSTLPHPTRHYNSRTPIKAKYTPHHAIPNLPHPNPLLLKAPPSHLAHLPRVLPMYRPYTNSVYQDGSPVPSSLPTRPYETHDQFKRRPTSLLDSYIPSSVQVEYLKRGLAKDPSSLYDALSSGRLSHAIPRYVERGFLPNQMYPTAAGGVTYGHYKRNPKIEKFPHK